MGSKWSSLTNYITTDVCAKDAKFLKELSELHKTKLKRIEDEKIHNKIEHVRCQKVCRVKCKNICCVHIFSKHQQIAMSEKCELWPFSLSPILLKGFKQNSIN